MDKTIPDILHLFAMLPLSKELVKQKIEEAIITDRTQIHISKNTEIAPDVNTMRLWCDEVGIEWGLSIEVENIGSEGSGLREFVIYWE